MFRSATFRLTIISVAITMAISILFSVTMYHFATGAIEFSAERQYQRLRRVYTVTTGHQTTPSPMGSEQTEAAHSLALNLVYLNLIILVVSAMIGYYWALQTLEPIERAMELQGQFAADASHELRTPLAAMRSEIEVALRSKQISQKEARELLASNLEEIAKLESLAGGLLQLARLESAIANAEPAAINTVVSSAIKGVATQAKAKNVHITTSGSNFSVVGDEGSLTQLVKILLDNAIKYGKTDGKIEIATKVSGHRGIITVKDNGPGIAADDLGHVFERFWRANPGRSKNQVEGFGLGLAIAREIASLHHGEVKVASTPGHGSLFSIDLPLASPKA